MKVIRILSLFLGSSMIFSLGGFRTPEWNPQQTIQGVDTLVSVQDLGVRKNFATTIVFQLQEGDSIDIDCEGCNYLLDNRRLEMKFLSFDPSDNRDIGSAELTQGFEVALSGEYKLSLSTNRRFSSINQLTVSVRPAKEKSSAQALLALNNVYIGNEVGGKNQSTPKFELFLQKDDSLQFLFTGVAESVPEVLTVEVEREEFSGKTPYEIGPDGSLSLSKMPDSGKRFFTLRAEKQRLSLSLKDIFDPKKDFYNLEAYRIPKEELVLKTGTDTDTDEEGKEDATESQEDVLAALVESLLPQPTPGLNPLPGQKIRQEVPATMQLTSSSRVSIPMPIEASADVLVYWLGTGPGAEKEFRKIEKEQRDRRATSTVGLPSELLGMYAHSILIRDQENPHLFYSSRADSVFREYVEFFIVDEAGKEAFEQGQMPRPKIGSSETKSHFHGFQRNVKAEPLFLCLINHNKYSSVDVTFLYSLYNQDIEP